jgi:hypothetical protein
MRCYRLTASGIKKACFAEPLFPLGTHRPPIDTRL